MAGTVADAVKARRSGPRVPRTGTVVEFDEPRGLGAVLDDDGRRYRFHCAAIADGTRTIGVGARVAFAVVPGHLGRDEAHAILPLPPA